MKIVILSGKGGTGKSSITSSIASVLSKSVKLVLVDADADCPNQHILFQGKEVLRKSLSVSKVAQYTGAKGSSCTNCPEICQFDAISIKDGNVSVDESACEGCGACVLGCPNGSFKLVPKLTGKMIVKETPHFPLVYTQLLPGETGSGRMVFEAKQEAGRIAEKRGIKHMIIDAPAGIGCPVIAAVSGCDLAIGVVEPTPASIRNLQRALEVTEHFKIPFKVVLNKYGLSEKYENTMRDMFGEALLASIPYDEELPVLLADGTLPLHGRGRAAEALRNLCSDIVKIVSLSNG
ncbi:MAG: ATP-binding protein [Candidatus Micrarchaeota archaeon]